MSDNFLGEIRLFPIGYAPRGWLPCEGQLLSIQQNAALYSLLGAAFGGNGSTNFQLPDLRGRVPQCMSNYPVGQQGGTEAVTLTIDAIPPHSHQAFASSTAADIPQPRPNSVLATSAGASNNIYKNTTPTAPLAIQSLTVAGGSVPHENRQPSLALHFCIATSGIYPPRP